MVAQRDIYRAVSRRMSCVCNGCKMECTCTGGNCCFGCCMCHDLDDDCAAQPSLMHAAYREAAEEAGASAPPRADQMRRIDE